MLKSFSTFNIVQLLLTFAIEKFQMTLEHSGLFWGQATNWCPERLRFDASLPILRKECGGLFFGRVVQLVEIHSGARQFHRENDVLVPSLLIWQLLCWNPQLTPQGAASTPGTHRLRMGKGMEGPLEALE